jgi:predicted RNase H-like HicB family nuclease
MLTVRGKAELASEILPDGSTVWVASDPELDGCLAQAESPEAALLALEIARGEYIEVADMLQRMLNAPRAQTFGASNPPAVAANISTLSGGRTYSFWASK